MYHIIRSSVEEYLGCLQFKAITNRMTMNMAEQVPLW